MTPHATESASGELPAPITSITINLLAFITSCISFFFLSDQLDIPETTVMVVLVYALVVIVLEAIFLKTWARPSTGLDFSLNKGWDIQTAATKLIGFYSTLAVVGFFYWIFPEYHGRFYIEYYDLLLAWLPWWAALAVPYFVIVNRFMPHPQDGYWHLGMLITGRRAPVDPAIITQHFLGWLVKAFFLPLMFIYLIGKVKFFQHFEWESLVAGRFKDIFDFSFNFLFYIDLLIVTVGYCMTLRIFDAHIRTTEYSFLGWGVALMCYQPFWSAVSGQYFGYDDGNGWGHWLWNYQTAYMFWGCLILALIGIYAWATLMFGIRFSNLTNRGILTHGPYRFTKHPAYVSKNISWWLISMPFLTYADFTEAIRLSFLLLLVNGIYFVRARTEERHLSQDPDYVRYAEYIEQHGLFRFVGHYIPLLKFRQGKLLNTDNDFTQVFGRK